MPDETLPPPDALHGKTREPLDGDSGGGGGGGGGDNLQTSGAAAASAPHKSGASGSSFLGDAFETLLYVLGFLVFAVLALRARVVWKQRKER